MKSFLHDKTYFLRVAIITVLVVFITTLHYSTPTMKWQYHLIYMQSYFIPILLAALWFGIKGGLGTAIAVSLLYFPHVMLQWGGLRESNLMRFLQMVLFLVIGYLTGWKAQREAEEKERYQEAARRLEKSLQKLREQSEQLKELEEQMRQTDRLAVVGELTASLAHEVRNPLGSIRGAVEILQDELPEAQKNSRFFRILIQETERLSAVVENYLSLARHPRRSHQILDLREVVQNAVLLLNHRARKGGVSLRTHLPQELVSILGDTNQLMHLLVNLVLNAIHATPQGKEVRVELTNRADRRVELCVSDQGSGIPEKEVEKLFRPFFTTKPNGTGLGLAIVKRIAEQNQWEIQVENNPEGGACFRVIFPRAGKPLPPQTEK